MSTKEIQVRPSGWEGAPAEELFVLSDMDHVRFPDVRITYDTYTDFIYHNIDHAKDLRPDSGSVQARTRC
jgi:hypothetical protein